jgi:hypothetical protein
MWHGSQGATMITDDQVAARVEAELRAQGLTDAFDDQTIRQVVELLGAGNDQLRARRRARVREELAGMEVHWKLLDNAESEP